MHQHILVIHHKNYQCIDCQVVNIIPCTSDFLRKTAETHTFAFRKSKQNLYHEFPPVDLLIRTSGEYRLSNFMMYQCAYSELYFPKIHWPDFREKQLDEAIIEFQKRDRRFGAIKK